MAPYVLKFGHLWCNTHTHVQSVIRTVQYVSTYSTLQFKLYCTEKNSPFFTYICLLISFVISNIIILIPNYYSNALIK